MRRVKRRAPNHWAAPAEEEEEDDEDVVGMGEKEQAEKEQERLQGKASQVIKCVVFNYFLSRSTN